MFEASYEATDGIREVNLLPMDTTLDADPIRPVATAVKELRPDEALFIRGQSKPQPFYDIWLKLTGVERHAERISDEEWYIWICRTS